MTISGHESLMIWTQIAALLTLARLLGALARRWGQPAIVGSLLAGLLLGPSVFGEVWPAGEHWFLPPGGPEPRLLTAVATFSLLVLLISLGAETDLPLIRSLGSSVAWVSAGSVALPLAGGLAVAFALPAGLVGGQAGRTAFALLLAGGLGASSLPVVARIVTELQLGRRDFGQLAIGAATVNDVFGFVLLAIAAALTSRSGGAGTLAVPLVGLVALVALTATVQPLIDTLLRTARRHGPNVAGSLAICFVTVFAMAAAAAALRIDAAFGGFLAGVALGRSRFQQSQALQVVEDSTQALFAPLYFATAGLHVDLATLAHPAAAAVFAVLLGVAAVSKFAGTALGGAIARLTAREDAALGFLLNGRGAMQVIIGSAALTMGVFGTRVYTMVIVIALLTSVLVAPAVRLTVGGWRGSPEEQQRLDRERELSSNVVVRGQRLLLPSRGWPNSVAAASVLDGAWPETSELTVLSVEPEPVRLQLPSRRPVRIRHVPGGDMLETVLAEANLGYGVIAVGAVEEPDEERLLPEMIEGLLGHSPLPLLVVRRGRDTSPLLGSAARFHRILTPVVGTASSRAAQEVAHNVSRHTGAPVSLLHVADRAGAPAPRRHRAVAMDNRQAASTAVLADAQSVAEEQEVPARTLLRHGVAGEEIARAVQDTGADLVVLGATARRVGGRAFLGHTVEHVLATVTAPTVAIIVLPEVAVTQTGEGHANRDAR